MSSEDIFSRLFLKINNRGAAGQDGQGQSDAEDSEITKLIFSKTSKKLS